MVLTNKHILALDEETTRTALRFEVVEMQGLQMLNQKNKPIKSFVMKDMEAGYISLKHDGSETRPVLKLRLRDAKHGVEQGVRISYKPINDAPQWQTSAWEMSQGQSLILDKKYITINDPDNKPVQLKMKVLEAKNLSFAHVDAPDTSIHTWSYQALLDKKIIAKHNDAVDAPSCVIEISDGKQASQQSPQISFKRIYKAPKLSLEPELHYEGQVPLQIDIGALMKLAVTDADGQALKRLDFRLLDGHDHERLVVTVAEDDVVSQKWEQSSLAIWGRAPIAHYVATTTSLQFHCEALVPGQHQRRIEVQAIDMDEQRSELMTVILHLRIPANDPVAAEAVKEELDGLSDPGPNETTDNSVE